MSSPIERRFGITGLGIVCPSACDIEAVRSPQFLASLRAERWSPDWFAAEQHLGPRGHKYYTQASRFLVAAVNQAVAAAAIPEERYLPEQRGMIVGTNFASFQPSAELDACWRASPDGIQPMDAPNFSVNIPASQASIKHRYLACNMTLTDPLVAGIQAIVTAQRVIAERRADVVVAGATEQRPPAEFSPRLGATDCSEGACAVVIEDLQAATRPTTTPQAEVGTCFLGFATGRDVATRLAGWRDAAIERHQRELTRPVPCCLVGVADLPSHQAELTEAFADHPNLSLCDRSDLGAAHATVSAMIRLTHLIAVYGRCIVVAFGPLGHIAALSLHPSADTSHP